MSAALRKAAQALLDYGESRAAQAAGYPDWDGHFDALRAALALPDALRGGWEEGAEAMREACPTCGVLTTTLMAHLKIDSPACEAALRDPPGTARAEDLIMEYQTARAAASEISETRPADASQRLIRMVKALKALGEYRALPVPSAPTQAPCSGCGGDGAVIVGHTRYTCNVCNTRPTPAPEAKGDATMCAGCWYVTDEPACMLGFKLPLGTVCSVYRPAPEAPTKEGSR